jgi:hypothetical protein
LSAGETIEISRKIIPADKRASPFFEISIDLTEGITRLDVSFHYTKTDICVLDIGILDSSATDYPTRTGFRGWSGGARDRFFVATDEATPGYYPGPLPNGTWKLLIGLYKVPPEGVDMVLHISADGSPRSEYHAAQNTLARRDAAGWYRGDLHCHTYHSDAKGAPETLAENARRSGLDFLAVTDHNTTSQWQYFGPASTPNLVFVPGMEITTYRGHANIFGLSEWIDFRLRGSHDLNALVREAHRQGALVSVNHDKEPLPWNYDYPEMDCFEVYHGHWLNGNAGILKTYDRFLTEGRRISLVGGSDYHQPEELKTPSPVGLGRPTTVLWLPHLDAASVVDGLRSGHGYVTESPTGPHLAFTANGLPMGSIQQSADEVIIDVEVTGAVGDRLAWISDSGVVINEIIPSDTWRHNFTIKAPEKFLRAEVIALESQDHLIGKLIDWGKERIEIQRALQSLTNAPAIRRALSNPVYFGA